MSNFGNTIWLPKAYAPTRKNDDVNVKTKKQKKRMYIFVFLVFSTKSMEKMQIL
jgi:hypothetical protein